GEGPPRPFTETRGERAEHGRGFPEAPLGGDATSKLPALLKGVEDRVDAARLCPRGLRHGPPRLNKCSVSCNPRGRPPSANFSRCFCSPFRRAVVSKSNESPGYERRDLSRSRAGTRPGGPPVEPAGRRRAGAALAGRCKRAPAGRPARLEQRRERRRRGGGRLRGRRGEP